LKYSADVAVQRFQARAADSMHRPCRMNPGAEQRFNRVDISHSRDPTLVHQKKFRGLARSGGDGQESRDGEFAR
jgi:hypothetical protein